MWGSNMTTMINWLLTSQFVTFVCEYEPTTASRATFLFPLWLQNSCKKLCPMTAKVWRDPSGHQELINSIWEGDSDLLDQPKASLSLSLSHSLPHLAKLATRQHRCYALQRFKEQKVPCFFFLHRSKGFFSSYQPQPNAMPSRGAGINLGQ